MYMTQENDNSPEKPAPKKPARKRAPAKRASGKKKTTKKSSEEEYKSKIQKALALQLDDYLKNRTLSQKQISTINSFIEEHLSCFVLLGYTVDGDPVSLLNANTQKDSDSLGTLLQKFMAKNVEPPSIPPMI
tara:strand:- start:127 stop:522 length:396 start_codon:yes stop_codon:yes gene_type:complete